MSSLRLFAIRCDHCGYIEETDANTGPQARRIVRDYGWTHPMGRPGRCQLRIDLCPTCSAGGAG